MKNKVFGLIVLLCLIIPINLSAKALDFSVGTTAQYQILAGSIENNTEAQENINNYDFGIEGRLKFLFLEATSSSIFKSKTPSSTEVSNLITAGISFDLINLVRVGVGVGPEYGVKFTADGRVLDLQGNLYDPEKAMLESTCVYKAHVDVLLGKVILSANYTVPTKDFTLTDLDSNNFDFGDLTPADLNNGKVGVSALISFI